MMNAWPRTVMIITSITVLIIIAVLNMEFSHEYPGLPARVDFNFDVKPILVQKCYLCHGPDPGTRKGGLRLDTYEGATALLKSGNYAINRDHPDISELISRIEHKDPDMIMPPPDSKMLLTEKEIAILSKWIKQGAKWKPHWAFIMPDTKAYEKAKNSNSNPVDFFINEQLDKNDLDPSDEADKNTLIRRASYLLTGLPPSVQEVKQFTEDGSADAYEKMIDHYLDSKFFGERWARHWMDIVRYAETRGHEFDFAIAGTWRYRDYLIRCFNSDIGYDQMVKEQLAGDLLEQPRRNPATGTNESHLGTVFLAMTEGVQGPVDIRQDEADRIDNMIDVTSKTFQSLTVSCARCHDHKFDPIATSDYYSLFGIMEGTRFSAISATTNSGDVNRYEALQAAKNDVRKTIAASWLSADKTATPVAAAYQTAGSAPANPATGYTVIGDFRGGSLGNWKCNGLAFGKTTTLGNPVFDRDKLLYLDEGKASSRINGTGIFGVLRSPNFTIATDSLLIRAMGKDATLRIVIDNFQLISDPIYGGNHRYINRENREDIAINVSSWKGHNAYIEIMPGVYDQHVYRLPANAYVEVSYAIAFDGKRPSLQNNQPGEVPNLSHAIKSWTSGRCTEQDVKLINQNLKNGSLQQHGFAIAGLLQSIDTSSKQQEDNTAFYNGVYDGDAINSPVFIRGDHKQTSPNRVPRHFFPALNVNDSAYTSTGSGRMELAESILDPKNPVTARVMVNRIWHYLFGRGIVETVDNFGLQGKLPTHPQLLDYLAIRFQKDNWSIKKMIRLIVLSETFRRSTNASENAQQKDPSNLYLARFPVLRLEGEAIRDGLLMASGRLDTTMYGPPVPVYLTSFMNGRGKPAQSGPVDGAGRRSIYQEVRRNFLDPMMLAFDRPIPFSTFGKRNVTNVPAQSLFLMNDSFVVIQAGLMAERLIAQKNKTEDEQIRLAYQIALSRPASEDEIKKGKDFLQKLSEVYGVRSNDIITNVIIWKDYCHSLFNLKEFIFLI